MLEQPRCDLKGMADADSSLLKMLLIFSLEWFALHTAVHLTWGCQCARPVILVNLRHFSEDPLHEAFKNSNQLSENMLIISFYVCLCGPLFLQYTRNNLRHNSNHWGQWAEPPRPGCTLLPHGLAIGPDSNPTSPGWRRPLNAQQLCCPQGKLNEHRHHHRALQWAHRPLQVCKQGASSGRAGEGGRGKQTEICKWWRQPTLERRGHGQMRSSLGRMRTSA